MPGIEVSNTHAWQPKYPRCAGRLAAMDVDIARLLAGVRRAAA